MKKCPHCETPMTEQTAINDQRAPWGGHSQEEEDILHCEGCGYQEPIEEIEDEYQKEDEFDFNK